MSVFSFKRFDVRSEASAMKVGTDAVLLGAAVPLDGSELRVLDVGTGTGTIALMLAQRLSALGTAPHILGIDSDEASAGEAAANFAGSPWSVLLEAAHRPLSAQEGFFDLVVSNPPYFERSLEAPDPRRNAARHAGDLSYSSLCEWCSSHLTPGGRLALILPADAEGALLRCARSFSLQCESLLRVRTVSRKAPSRLVASFIRREQPLDPCIRELTMQEEGRYTEGYTGLVKDFYLWA